MRSTEDVKNFPHQVAICSQLLRRVRLANAYHQWPKRSIPADFLPKQSIPRNYTGQALKLLHTGVGTMQKPKEEEQEEEVEGGGTIVAAFFYLQKILHCQFKLQFCTNNAIFMYAPQ